MNQSKLSIVKPRRYLFIPRQIFKFEKLKALRTFQLEICIVFIVTQAKFSGCKSYWLKKDDVRQKTNSQFV